MAAIDSWYKKALPLTQFLKENEMGKLVAPFMLNMGVDIICNAILKYHSKHYDWEWPYETLQYIYIYIIYIFKRPRIIMNHKSNMCKTL